MNYFITWCFPNRKLARNWLNSLLESTRIIALQSWCRHHTPTGWQGPTRPTNLHTVFDHMDYKTFSAIGFFELLEDLMWNDSHVTFNVFPKPSFLQKILLLHILTLCVLTQVNVVRKSKRIRKIESFHRNASLNMILKTSYLWQLLAISID